MINWFKERKWTLLYILFTIVSGLLGAALYFLLSFAVYHLGDYSFEFSLLPTDFFEWFIMVFLAATFAFIFPAAIFGQLGWFFNLTTERELLNKEREMLNEEQEKQYTKEKSAMKKTIWIIVIVALLTLPLIWLFLLRPLAIHINIAGIANEKGEKYGITDFSSKSTFRNSKVEFVKLYSNKFDSLSDDDKLNLMASLCTDNEMVSVLADDLIEAYKEPLKIFLQIHSEGKCYNIGTDNEDDLVVLTAEDFRFEATGIKEHGFLRPFTNDYGSENTPCHIWGCPKKIARSGDTNCCTDHSNRCGNCYCYIDRDASFCMSCLKSALS